MVSLMVFLVSTAVSSAGGSQYSGEYWESFPAGWFGANMYGVENASQLEAIGRYKIAVLGWQHEIWPANFTNISSPQLDQIGKIKDKHPTLPVFMYLAMGWAPPMWPAIDQLVHDPSVKKPGGLYYDYFLQTTDEDPTPGPLYTDIFCGGVGANATRKNCRSLYWNMANEAARDYLAEKVVMPLAKDPRHDGVFFDACGFLLQDIPKYNMTNLPGTDPASKMSAYWNGVMAWQKQLKDLFAPLPVNPATSRPKVPMFSLGQNEANFFREGFPGRDEWAMVRTLGGKEGWIRYYEGVRGEAPYPALENMIVEAQLGISVVMHVYLNSLEEDITTHLALFLIARGDGFYFMASTNWFDDDWRWYPEYDYDYGRPLGIASKIPLADSKFGEAVEYRREYTKCQVSLKCKNGANDCSGSITFT